MSRRLIHLDGLRGVSILLVLTGHWLVKAGADSSSLAKIFAPLDNSSLGVEIFFVLSGYLITSILLRERERSGSISLRRFFVRRALRIWPAFYCLLAVLVLLGQFSRYVNVDAGQALSASLFVWNYSPAAGGWWLGHTWSLSIEEQFYLLWPLMLVLCTPRRAFLVAAGIILAEPVVRVGSYLAHIGQPDRIPVYFHTRADFLLMGAAVALLPLARPAMNERVRSAIARYRLGAVAVATLAASSWLAVGLRGTYLLSVGWTLEALCIATILLDTSSQGTLRRLLSSRPLVLLGTISFSVYLWQQLFMAPWRGVPVLGSIELAPVLALAVAGVSYRYVERPFLSLKDRHAAATRSIALEAGTRDQLAVVTT